MNAYERMLEVMRKQGKKDNPASIEIAYVSDGQVIHHGQKLDKDDYLITEDKTGTSLFFGKIINGTRALPELIRNHLDYGLLDTSFISKDTSLQVLELFNEIKEKVEIGDNIDLDNYLEKTASLIGDSTNFFYQKTIYKVKKGK